MLVTSVARFCSVVGMMLLIAVQCHAAQHKTAIASAHPLATAAGFEVLEQGGNVYDAAVAVSAALAVVEPSGSGLGGGGFWLLHRQRDDLDVMIDGREKAPIAAHREMYLDENGAVLEDLSINGVLAAGIPGMPAALVHIAQKYGKLPLSASLQPAIRYARQGFNIGDRHLKLLRFRENILQRSTDAAAIFLNHGEIPEAHALLVQKDLANTLQKLADAGKAGFYQGDIAEKLVAGVQAAGGIWTLEDLTAYNIVEREPVRGNYRGIRIVSAAPPSSGGIVLMEALNILSAYDLQAADEVVRKHFIVEAMRRAYHDRALYLGDPDYVRMPVERLLSMDYAAGLSRTIRPDRALPSVYLAGEAAENQAGRNTSHFSIIDDQGNGVAATLSINFPFGAGVVPPGTGVLLNNEMDDFVSRPGVPNGYGLIGGAANAIAAEKRMLSSMTPTFADDGQRVAVLGTPGGSRIISMVLLAVLDFAEGHGPESWVSVPRFHHQYLPDSIQYEKDGLHADEIKKLTDLGHHLTEVSYRYGDMQAVSWHKQTRMLSAASDPRGEGLAIVR